MMLMAEQGRDGAARGIGETGDSQVDGSVAAGGDLIHLGELGASASLARAPTRLTFRPSA